MKPAIAYLRVSSDRQAKKGMSLEDQRAHFDSWCKRSGHECIHVFQSTKTAKRADNRPEFQRAVAMACEKKAALVVWCLDRFARSVLDAFHVASQLDKAGACLVSIKENFDMTTAMGRAMFGMTAVFAQLERERISERCAEASAFRKARGLRYNPNVPYGKKIGPDGKKLLDAPKEQRALGMIKELRASGLSYQKIADRLESCGITTKSGKPKWSKRLIKSILERTDNGKTRTRTA